MSNLKKYNLFIFITSFAKLLVELFIPLILYKNNYSINDIILFLILKYTFCLIFIPIGRKIGNKLSYTKLMLISALLFGVTYIYLNYMKSLIILSILYSSYLMFYWLGRHVYALSIIENKKTTDNTSLYTIFTILGGLFSSYIGALIIEKFNYFILSIIVVVLMFLSIIPLTKIKDVKIEDENKTLDVMKTFPKRNYIFIVLDQLRYIIITLFPLYIYINVKSNLKFIGFINIIAGVGSVIYIYFLSKKMDKNKKDYLSLSLLLISIVYLFKLFIINKTIFLFIIFMEGIISSSIDTITLRNIYCYGKNYSVISYVTFIELLNNFGRTIFLVIFYFLKLDLVYIILVSILGILTNVFIKFDDGKYGYSNS